MSRPWILLAPLAALLAPAAPPARADDVADKLAAYMEAAVKADDFRGAVIVTKDGAPLLSRGYGEANIEHGVANTPQTKFRLGSITKQFTAMAVLILQEQGKLKVEDPIGTYLDDAPEAWQGVTIRHLLTHTSGIPSYTGDPEYPKKMRLPQTHAEMIARFRDKPLEFAPGSEFRYSNSGYYLLGVIIEKASGQPYEAFLRSAVFEPLGMADTGYDHPEAVLPRRAAGYEPGPDGLANAPFLDMSQPFAAGSLYSTVEDLVRWDQALRDRKLVGPDAYEAMFTPFKGHYAYGWDVREKSGRTAISHGGGINGFSTMIVRYPEQGVCAVALSNVIPSAAGRIAEDLARIALGDEVAPPQPRVAAKIDPAAAAALVGRYEVGPGAFVTFLREGDRYFVLDPGQARTEVFPESETTFFPRGIDATITFVKDDQGRVTHLVLRHGDREQKAARVAADAQDGGGPRPPEGR